MSPFDPDVPSNAPLASLTAIAPPEPRAEVWERIVASREAGVRPLADPFARPASPMVDDAALLDELPAVPRRRWWPRAAAVAACAAVAWMMLRPQRTLEAGMVSGTMQLTPALPKAGERVQVRYTAGALLGRPDVLRLRARVRTVHGENYVTYEPVITLGTLRRVDGTQYTGSFVLPDSFVYAALAVEDTAAREVDDFGGRTWEVLRAGANGEPTLDALEQRTNDLMGRSWEAGLTGVRRMVALYPDSVRSWRWLHSYESWMSLETDSTKAVHRQQLARLSARDLANPRLPADHVAEVVWYARGVDTTVAAQWIARLQREAPRHETAIYLRGLATLQQLWSAQTDTAHALAAMESLWPVDTPDRRAWLAGRVAELAVRDSARAAVWGERVLAASRSLGARRAAAQGLLEMPPLRARGKDALRALLAATTVDREPRLLDESARAHAARIERSRRATLSALGQALAKDGALAAACDTLERAAAGGWDAQAFDALGDVRLALGDTSGAVDAWSRVAIDPRTSAARRTTLDATVRRLGRAGAWPTAMQQSRALLSTRLAERAIDRHVDDVTLTALDGRAHTLSALRGARGTVVLFWSHQCGYAVEAVPELQALAARLTARGIAFVFVADAQQVTPELTATLAEKHVTLPVYLDATGRAAATFNNWGTPMLYVLDAKGRVAFPGTSAESDVLLYAEAVGAGGFMEK